MKKKYYLLDRSGEGFNRVFANFDLEAYKGHDPATASHIKTMKEFLSNLVEFENDDHQQIFWHRLALEIGQVLKVPWKDIANVIDSGYINYYAQENLEEYFRRWRISPKRIEFLQSQEGEAGVSNEKPH